MDDFMDKLLRLRSGFFGRMRLLFIFDLIAIFSIFYAIFIILNVGYLLAKSTLSARVPVEVVLPLLAFILAAIFAFLLHKKDRRINVPLLIESKYPELKEKLRTACDNRGETNVIVDSLKIQVSEALNNVSVSQVLPSGRMLAKMLIAAIFLSGMFIISSNPDGYRVSPQTLDNMTGASTDTTGGGTNGSVEVVGRPEVSEQAGQDGGGDILGRPQIAPVEGKNVDLTLPSGNEAGYEVRDTSKTQDQFIKNAAFPVDALGSNASDSGYSTLMKKTETEKELINKYAVERSKI